MKLGAEPKRLAILGGLALVAGYFVYTSVFSSEGAPPGQPRGATGRAVPELAAPPEPERAASRSGARLASRSALQEFRPSLKPRRGSGAPDLGSIDPTLRLDLLAKLQDVTLEGGQRSLFEFSAEPPKTPEPKVIPKTPAEIAKALTEKMNEAKAADPNRKPPAPPIALRFFGYAQARQGTKRAFFLDGDDILVGSEGDILKKRYKVVRIGVNSVVMEDVEGKNEQTLPLEAQIG